MTERTFATQDEVAEYLGLTQATVNKLIKSGEIKGKRFGSGTLRAHYLFSSSDLDACLLERIKRKVKDKYDKQMAGARLLLALFRELDATPTFVKLNENNTIEEVLKSAKLDEIDVATERIFGSLARLRGTFSYKFFVATYKELHKDVRTWLRNQLTKNNEQNAHTESAVDPTFSVARF